MGFIHGPLDIKLLILYIMSRVAAPIGQDTLTELVMDCEEVDYFLFAQELGGLLQSEHLMLDDGGLYSVTEKGRTNSSIMEDSLSSVIRGKADRGLAALNAKLRRSAQVTAKIVDEDEDRCRVELGLSDHTGPLFSLALAVPSHEQGEKIVERYEAVPEACFNAILSCLLKGPEEKE